MADIAPKSMAEEIEIDLVGPGAALTPADPDEVELKEDEDDTLPKRAILKDDGSVTLPLLFPRTLKWKTRDGLREESYEEFVFHRLTGADLRAINAVSGEKMAVVAIARSARINEAKVGPLYDRLDGADAAACMQVVSSFLATGRKTTGR